MGQGDGDLLEGVLERAIPLRPQALGDLALDAGHRGVDSGPLLQAKRGRYDELRPPIGGSGSRRTYSIRSSFPRSPSASWSSRHVSSTSWSSRPNIRRHHRAS